MNAIVIGTALYQALKDEGFDLPAECGDVVLEMPVNGVFRLRYEVLVMGEDLVKLGRALARVGEEQK
jgi:hypothetical protein